MKKERISKANYYMKIAKEVASRGTCLKRNYGAVIVNNDEIISTGYTGSPRGCRNCIDTDECIRIKNKIPGKQRYELCKSVHAEMNAIISASRSDMIGARMYLVGVNPDGTLHNAMCCDMCKKLIINSGIESVACSDDNGHIHYYDVNKFVEDIDNMNDESKDKDEKSDSDTHMSPSDFRYYTIK